VRIPPQILERCAGQPTRLCAHPPHVVRRSDFDALPRYDRPNADTANHPRPPKHRLLIRGRRSSQRLIVLTPRNQTQSDTNNPQIQRSPTSESPGENLKIQQAIKRRRRSPTGHLRARTLAACDRARTMRP
jgi:hypothetical protein